MALLSDTLYEIQEAGVPKQNFTVRTAGRTASAWVGMGVLQSLSTPKPKLQESRKPTDTTITLNDRDSDRPVLKRKKQQTPSEQTTSSGSSDSDARQNDADPNRPVLKRGAAKRSDEPEQKFGAEEEGKQLTLSTESKLMVAVSDTESVNTRPLSFVWRADEEKATTAKLTELAIAELRKTAPRLGYTIPAKGTIELKNIQARAFDIDYSNSPQIIFSAYYTPSTSTLSPEKAAALQRRAGLEIVLVARFDYDNKPQKVFASVSDPLHLSDNPELQLVDAVDADGDGRAEFLFERTKESGTQFVIYRMYGNSFTELFATADR